MSSTHISAAMRSALGAEVDRKVSFPISASDIRRWAIAVYHPEPPPQRFIRGPVGREDELIAPDEFNPFAWAVAKSKGGATTHVRNMDAHEHAAGIDGPGLIHAIAARMRVEHAEPMRVGDVITSVTRLHDYRERTGRLGLMLFTDIETTWTNQRGELVHREILTSIRY